MDAAAKTVQVQSHVLEIVTYFSLFDVPVSMERLVSYLPAKANHLAVAAAIRDLIIAKRVVRIGDEYGVKGHKYDDRKAQLKLRAELLERASSVAALLGVIPFVKSIVVVNSVAIGNVTKESDIDLVVVTTPGRIFIAQRLICLILGIDRARKNDGGHIDLDTLITIRGVAMERDIMRTPEPHLKYWLLTAVPVYGDKRWAEILQGSSYFRDLAPNMIWPRGGKTIDRWSWRWLDSFDDRRYRKYLKQNSQNSETQSERAFIRIRPDIINIHANDKSTEIARRWDVKKAKLL